MKRMDTYPGILILMSGFCLHSYVGLVWLGLTPTTFLLSPVPATAQEDQATTFPGLGEPRILFVAHRDSTDGYWTSLAFTQDSKSLIGTLVRHPGSLVRFLPRHRVGEVRSFDLGVKSKASNIVTTAGNTQFEILKTPSGASREPLLLAGWHHVQPKEVVVFQVTTRGPKESLLGRFQTPRASEISPHTYSHVCVAVTPPAKTFILGTGLLHGGSYPDPKEWSGDVMAWDVQNGHSRFAGAWESSQVAAIACSPDGKFIAAAVDHLTPTGEISTMRIDEAHVVCWARDFEKKHFELRLPKYGLESLAFAPDSRTLVTGGKDGVAKWFVVQQGKVLTSLNIARYAGKGSGTVQCLAFAPNGQLLAAGVGSWWIGAKWGETFLIDVRKAQVYKVPSSQEGHVITCVAFSPNGKYLAAGGMKGVLKLWEMDGGEKGGEEGTGARRSSSDDLDSPAGEHP